jgi:hypothetical protein
MKIARKSCVIVRRSFKKSIPVVQQTGRFVERHVVHTSVASFIPSVVNNAVIHHMHVTPDQLLNVATDNVSVSSMTALAMLLMRLI